MTGADQSPDAASSALRCDICESVLVQSTAPGTQAYDYPMIYEAKLVGNDFDTASSYHKLIKIASGRTAPTYLIITNQMKIYDWYFGILPLHALDHLEVRLRNDTSHWSVYKSTGHAVEDESAVRLVYERALAEGAGQVVTL